MTVKSYIFKVYVGSSTEEPRWQRCTTAATNGFPDVMSHRYVQTHFDASSKTKVSYNEYKIGGVTMAYYATLSDEI